MTAGHTTRRPTAAEQSVRRHVVLASGITALGGLLFGYDTGVVSGALLFLKDDFGGLTSFQQELVTSLLLVGAAVGALLAGRIADRVGRRLTVLGTALVFVVGVLLAAFAASFPMLLAARVVIGLAVGSASMVVPLYIGEVAPPKIRGGLVSLNQLAITVGILVSYLADYWLAGTKSWRLMFGLAAIPAVLLFVGMLFQKESPHWLVMRGREAEARQVLSRLRAPEEIDPEIAEVHRVTEMEHLGTRDLFGKNLRRLVAIGVLLAIFQQITGINTVIYYAPTLLSEAGFGTNGSLLANVVNGA
ncbi:MAG: sugar porter family MFS transporter, partial [Trebonia sp.]